METTNHLFCDGEVALKVWKYFQDACGLSINSVGGIRAKFIRWWLIKPQNKVHDMILQCLPSIICWEIWKYRYTYKYEGIRSSIHRIIGQITYLMQLLLSTEFPSLPFMSSFLRICQLVDIIKPQLHILPVRWNKPSVGEFKLNVDGCSKGNPGNAGCGGVLRDHLGRLIMAFTVYLGSCSNNSAEAQAIKTGVRWCLDHGFNRLTVESDSLVVIQMIRGEISTTWHIKDEISAIQAMNLIGNFHYVHTLQRR
ncbi:putative ribonuclease h protein [Nicotiana attenuata]|uniref:Ribonuclease h protein n=1 Tax=Nicotiana attenuata TaxID=49451 RepID=A0A1J6HYT4_NICAT|nr:putative ribonuclease h protein [Nicotiana attenuata]